MTLLRLFGAPVLECSHRMELPLHRPVWLLLVLAHRGVWVGRDELLALFWPEAHEAAARHGLRLWLSRAKAMPWVEGLEIERGRLRWAPQTDVAAFRAAIGRGAWVEALQWYRAPLLSGVASPDLPPLDEWLLSEREALQGAARQAALQATRQLATHGEHIAAAELLRGILAHDPLAEGILGAFMEQASRAGQRDEALRRYGRFATLLERELGATPLETTRRLAALIEQGAAWGETEARLPAPPIPPQMARPPTMVGRDAATRHLTASSRRLTIVTGEPGVGKSRLLEETLGDALWLRCREATRGVPLHPIVEYVRAAPDAVAAIGPYARDVTSLAPELAEGAESVPAATDVAKTRLFEGLARLLEAAAPSLVVEDLHWADPLTLEMLGLLVVRGRVRVIASRRPGRMPAEWQPRLAALRASGLVDEIRLARLDRDGVQAMLAAMIGSALGPHRFSAWLHGRTGGNPLFVVETLKMLVERGVLDVAPGHWQTQLDALTHDYSELEVPAGVQEIIRQRADECSSEARRVLEMASVLGELGAPERLAKLVGVSEWDVAAAYEELEAHGLVDGGTFSHDLVRTALYERLGVTRRAHLHGMAAAALEGGDDPWLVAEHWRRAHRPDRAAAQFLAAGERAATRGWWAHALAAATRSLELVPSPDARYLQASACISGGAVDDADPAIEALIAEADRTWQVRGSVLRTHQEIRRGRLERAQEAARAAADLVPGLSLPLRLEAFTALANTAALSGMQAEVVEPLEALLEEMEEGSMSRQRVQALSNLAWLHTGLGRFDRALALYHDAATTADAVGDSYWTVWIAANTLYCCLEAGRPEAALPMAERLLGEESSDAHEILRINLAKAYVDLGRPSEAVALLETLLTTALDPSNRAVALGYLVELYARTGDPARSRDALDRALALLRATDLDRARVRIAIAALRHGDEAQRAEVADVVPRLRQGAVPAYVWREFVAVRDGAAVSG